MRNQRRIATLLFTILAALCSPGRSNAQDVTPSAPLNPSVPASSSAPAPAPEPAPDLAAPRPGKPADVVISISQETLTQFADAAMPLTLDGTNVVRMNLPVVGLLEVTIPWVAVVTNPQVVILKDSARFDADVQVTAAGVIYNDKVHGLFEIVYDPEQSQLVVHVKEAFLNLSLQGKRKRVTARAKVDVSDKLPPLKLPLPLPGTQMKIGGNSVGVDISPTIEYQEGALVISSSIKLLARTPPAAANSR